MNLTFILSDLLHSFLGVKKVSKTSEYRKRRPFDLGYKEEMMDKKTTSLKGRRQRFGAIPKRFKD